MEADCRGTIELRIHLLAIPLSSKVGMDPQATPNLEPDCRSRACSHMNTKPLIPSLGTDECCVVDHVFRILQGKTGASNGCGTPETQYM